MTKWFVLFGLMVASFGCTGQQQPVAQFEEGVNYHWVGANPSAGDRIEVIEFFWYGCPHCYSFEPFIEDWLSSKPEDVSFLKVPATFNRPNVMMHARTFYALEAMGAPSTIHLDIMKEMHDRKNPLAEQGAMEQFLGAQGIDLDAYRNAMKSFTVNVKVQQAAQLAQRFSISGVPSLVVDSQFRSGDVRNYEHMIELLDYLVEQARKARSGG
jgi:thiol:disulfide interchange protein DsbA